MEAVILLCDAAQVHDGKLYILGGGFSVIWVPNQPTPLTIAVKLSVPWDRTNQRLRMAVSLLSEDGDQIEIHGTAVQAAGDLEVGRPPGIKPGTTFDVPVALPFGLIGLDAGGYTWVLTVNDEPIASAPLRVMAGPPGMAPMG